MRCKDEILPEQFTKSTLLFVLVTKRIRENRKLTVYVSLELSFGIFMGKGDLRKKLKKGSIFSYRN